MAGVLTQRSDYPQRQQQPLNSLLSQRTTASERVSVA